MLFSQKSNYVYQLLPNKRRLYPFSDVFIEALDSFNKIRQDVLEFMESAMRVFTSFLALVAIGAASMAQAAGPASAGTALTGTPLANGSLAKLSLLAMTAGAAPNGGAQAGARIGGPNPALRVEGSTESERSPLLLPLIGVAGVFTAVAVASGRNQGPRPIS